MRANEMTLDERDRPADGRRDVICNPGEAFHEALRRTVEDLGQPVRQQILDMIKNGKKVGEVCDAFDLGTIIVGRVIVDNIEKSYFLSREAK